MWHIGYTAWAFAKCGFGGDFYMKFVRFSGDFPGTLRIERSER